MYSLHPGSVSITQVREIDCARRTPWRTHRRAVQPQGITRTCVSTKRRRLQIQGRVGHLADKCRRCAARTGLLDRAVVLTEPGADSHAYVLGGLVPDQQHGRLAAGLQPGVAPQLLHR